MIILHIYYCFPCIGRVAICCARLYNYCNLQLPQSLNQPNSNQLNLNLSNLNQPNLNQPNLNRLNLNQLNPNQLNLNQPNLILLNLNQPNLNQPKANLNQLNLNQPKLNQPNLNDPNLNQSNNTGPVPTHQRWHVMKLKRCITATQRCCSRQLFIFSDRILKKQKLFSQVMQIFMQIIYINLSKK